MRNYFRFVVYLAAAICFSANAASPDVAFFRAVNIDDERTVRQHLAEGLDPNISNPQGQHALYLAMKEDSHKVASLLVAHPTIRIDATTRDDETALMMAALRGQVDWVRRLAKLGAAINRPGWTPLHYACSGPEGVDAARFLLDQGADVDARSPNGTTPLMMAARYGSDACAELLLARGAKTQLRNQRLLNAADFARLGGRAQLAERLAKLAGP